MGYSTEFRGKFKLDKPLQPHHAAYLWHFIRHDNHQVKKSEEEPDNIKELRERCGIPLNIPGIPDTVCQWIPNRQGTTIKWDGRGKFYDYDMWIRFLVDNFIKPWGYKLKGRVQWVGEDKNDYGEIVIDDNNIEIDEQGGEDILRRFYTLTAKAIME